MNFKVTEFEGMDWVRVAPGGDSDLHINCSSNAVSSVKASRRLRRNTSDVLATYPLHTCLAYCSTLKMGATLSSEASDDFQRTARRYFPEDGRNPSAVWFRRSSRRCCRLTRGGSPGEACRQTDRLAVMGTTSCTL
jgi:hypothetical protein